MDDLSIRMKYVAEKDYKYNGQLKLFITTLNFLLDNIKKNDIVLYIGSGKGYNIPILIEAFMAYNIEWHLYDPAGHCSSLERNGDIYVNNIYFTIEEAKKFVRNNIKENRLVFISDIRTTEDTDGSVRSSDLLKNYELQNDILNFLDPRVSFLKWRCPFPDDWIRNFDIPCGKEYLQPYVSKFSNELRLVCKSPYTFKTITKYDSECYEELLYYYNKILRRKNNIKIVTYILSKMPESMKKILKLQGCQVPHMIEIIVDRIQDEKKDS